MKNCRKSLNSRIADPTHGRAQTHCRPCACAWLRPQQHGRAAPVHNHMSLRVFPFALPGLRLTSTLLLIPPESYLFHQNPKVLPENTDKLQYKHN